MIRRNEPPGSSTNADVKAILNLSCTFNSEQIDQLANAIENEDYGSHNIGGKVFYELQNQWNNMLPKSRILSLTEENDNPVMCSSYSNNYKGVVVELSCLDLVDTPLLLAEPVVYSDDLVMIGSLEYWINIMLGKVQFDYTDTFRKLELTKKLKWAYEKEWRVLSFEKNSNQLFDDYRFSPYVFSKIYFGHCISDDDKKEIMSIIKKTLAHMKCFNMNLNYSTHEIEYEELT